MTIKKPFKIFDTINGWDLSTGSYSSKSKDVSAQTTSPKGIFFLPSGRRMYLVDNSGISSRVRQYTLTTPWDISTLTYDNISFDSTSQKYDPVSITCSPDGKNFYLATLYVSGNAVYQYSMSTPWDMSTAVYASKSYDPAEMFGINSVRIKPDGTKMFLLSTSSIFQYTLSTPWDVSTASYDSKLKALGSIDAKNCYFRDDGRKLYVTSNANDDVRQWTMSTPWDVSTLSYDSVAMDVSTQMSSPWGLFIGDDGTKLYVTSDDHDTIFQYGMT